MSDAAKAAARPQEDFFDTIVQDFADQTLPLSDIASAVGMATSKISSDVTAAFTSNSTALGQGFNALTEALKEAKFYTVTDPKTGQEVATAANALAPSQ